MTQNTTTEATTTEKRTIADTSITRKDGEYIVRAYDQHGARWPECDYHTDDKEDAYGTARFMVDPEANGQFIETSEALTAQDPDWRANSTDLSGRGTRERQTGVSGEQLDAEAEAAFAEDAERLARPGTRMVSTILEAALDKQRGDQLIESATKLGDVELMRLIDRKAQDLAALVQLAFERDLMDIDDADVRDQITEGWTVKGAEVMNNAF